MNGDRFTIFGGRGFLGTALATALRARGVEPRLPERQEAVDHGDSLGHVLYVAGVTSDFRRRPVDAARAHVVDLAEVLERARFESLLYLSSTRVYQGADAGLEDRPLEVDPSDPEQLYALSKLLGESLCLSRDAREIRVARLSNVYGPGDRSENFVSSILRDAIEMREVRLRTALDSAKDYVSIFDAVPVLLRIAKGGKHRLYNVASGVRTSHRDLLERVIERTGCRVVVEPGAPSIVFPPIAIDRIREEFGFRATPFGEGFGALLEVELGAGTS